MIVSLVAALLSAASALPAPALPQDQPAPTGQELKRVRSITLADGQACPKSTDEEIIVCNKVQDPYRIPKQFRDAPKQDAPGTSWAVKADRAMDDNRRMLPGSCSAIGTNGQTGCSQQAAEEWAAEKRAKANGQSIDPPQ